MTHARCRIATGGRRAPRRIAAALALAAALLAGVAGAADVARVFVALRDGRELVALDARLAIVQRVALRSPVDAIAASSDGCCVALAQRDPPALVVLGRDLAVLRELPARDADGRRASPVTAIADHPARRSFVAALPGLPELWEVSYDPSAAPIFPGLVHDFRMNEGLAVPGWLNARRAPLETAIDDLLVDPVGADVVGSERASTRRQVVNLHVRRRIAQFDAPPAPAGAGAWWREGAAATVASPAGRALALVDAATWRQRATLPVDGEVRLARAHPRAAQAWIAVRRDGGDVLVLLDRARGVVADAVVPGGRIVDVAFGADGADVFVLLAGAAARFDGASGREIARVLLDAPLRFAVR